MRKLTTTSSFIKAIGISSALIIGTATNPAWSNPVNDYTKKQNPNFVEFEREKSKCTDPDADFLVDNFEAWRREVGPEKFSCWDGDLTLYDGNRQLRQPSTSWPYRVDDYRGLICIKLQGNQLLQRNIFFYPPASAEFCHDNGDPIVGDGVCGVNGNARIFKAVQTIAGCDGSLEGPFPVGNIVVDTRTTVEGDNVVNYEVKLMGAPFQTQQTTLTPDGTTRIRNAMSLIPFTNTPSLLSFYIEKKVTPLSEQAVRDIYEQNLWDYNIPNDGCQFDGITSAPSGTDCETFFFDFFFDQN